MNRFIDMGITDAAKKLDLSSDFIKNFKLVYKKTEDIDSDGNNLYRYAGVYELGIDYGDECMILPVTSVFEGGEKFTAGTCFANILGSSGDVGYDADHSRKSWKQFARMLGISWECHAQENMFYDYITKKPTKDKSFDCNDRDISGNVIEACVVGGHVIMNCERPKEVRDNSTVYIVPICKHHNSKCLKHLDANNHNSTPGNGNGFFMKLKDDTNVIKVSGYKSGV